MPGVGMIPAICTSAPSELMPEANAPSSIRPLVRVSRPITILRALVCLTYALPSLSANSGVMLPVLARSLTPSVPKNFLSFPNVRSLLMMFSLQQISDVLKRQLREGVNICVAHSCLTHAPCCFNIGRAHSAFLTDNDSAFLATFLADGYSLIDICVSVEHA